MRSWTLAGALLTLLALPCWAQTTPSGGAASTPQLVAVVEPGKPMRFEVVNPLSAASAAGPEHCELELPQDRRAPTSEACLRCHDGSGAMNAKAGHRFDVEYSTYGRELRLDPEKYNPKVVLASGKVTCMSCHEPLSTAPFRLVAPTGGPLEQRLCTACHIR